MVNVDLRFHPFCANAMRSSVTTSCWAEVLLQPASRSIASCASIRDRERRAERAGRLRAHRRNAATPFEIDLVGNALP
jgi:hypothetical protein